MGLFFAMVFEGKSLIGEGILAFFCAAAYAWSPAGYSVSDRAVVVRRPIDDVRIPADGIRDARIATADDLHGRIRLFGSGGLFGYHGLFRISKLGKTTWYVTNRSHSVALFGDSETVLLSPDDVDGFIGAVRKFSAISPTGRREDSGCAPV